MSKNIDPVKIRAFIKATKETSKKDDNKKSPPKKESSGDENLDMAIQLFLKRKEK
ncbi:hypothetical protein [Sphingobacterium psychroaquaticum]|uniref:hypothetical protein n=1 Tax=Sphingobacterium psychroaquaticum TaxID=561061 RepID=UPI00141AEF28|nr:hypothetical protein [Sphingobacterium psychroaquaticum]